MVLKHVTNPATRGKLESKWEGSYVITCATREGSYYMATPKGQQLDHTWNAKSILKFYPYGRPNVKTQLHPGNRHLIALERRRHVRKHMYDFGHFASINEIDDA